MRDATVEVVFDPGGPSGADGRTWYEPGACACTVTVPDDPAADAAAGEVACRFAIELWTDRPGEAADLLVIHQGSAIREMVVLSGVEHSAEIVLSATPAARHRVDFRLAGTPGAPAALHVRSLGAEVRRRDRGRKEAVIAAGLAASLALFPAPVADAVWSNAPALADLLAEAVRARQPFSMIRLGDGEGRLLAHPILMSPRETESATVSYMFGPSAVQRLQALYGPKGVAEAVVALRHLVAQAMENADCVGLPAPEHFRRYQALAEGPRKDALTPGLVGFAGALFATSRHLRLPPDRLFDTYIFHALQESRLFDRILGGLDFLGVVAHTDRRREIGDRFGIATVAHVPVPPHYTFMPSAEPHYPTGFERIVEALRPPFPGAPYLVAAGYLGKAYCDVIKARGGVAIDIGSVFDGWFGVGNPMGTRNVRLRLSPP